MTLDADEFRRRFLLHVLLGGFHRIRHYGFLATGNRTASLSRIRELLLQQADVAAQTPGFDGELESARPSFFCRTLRRSDAHPADLRARAVDSRAALQQQSRTP
ncbi:transposase [Variovorax sp. YR752]|uniref:transposase n=1 Tax=Variovorax sp. YR752 TaxID=1884383 RepID=UPI000BE2C7B0